MSTGTITPTPFQTVEGYDADGLWGPIAGALIYTYDAGTMDPATTYSNVGLTSANNNPIEADSSGRWSAFLVPGNSYKFYYCLPVTPIPDPSSPPSAFRTADNILATPLTSQALDVAGIFGENVTASQCVYLSDGSGGKTTGRWYLADATNAYSSTLPDIGFAVANATAGDTGLIRQAGQVTGLGALSAGFTSYVGAAGALTGTAPAFARVVGQADSATSLIATPNPTLTAAVDNAIVDGRLTLTTAVPITVTDVTAATTIYFTPYAGSRITVYDGTRWLFRTFAELSIAVPATTATVYDIFVFDNAGTLTLELTAWTNDTTRATALTTQNGVLVKTGALTRRYLGSFRTTAVSGQTEDSFAKRYLWNYYHRVPRHSGAREATNTWTYTVNTYQQANASTANQADFVIGVAEVLLDVAVSAKFSNSGPNPAWSSIGEDSTSAAATGVLMQQGFQISNGQPMNNVARLVKYPAVGRHFYAWLEKSTAAGTTTWYGDNGDATQEQYGIVGTIQG